VAESKGGNSGGEVVQLLEGVATRLGKSLGQDVARAAGTLYKDAQTAIGKVVQGVEAADSRVAADFAALSRQIEEGKVPHKVKVYVTNNGYPERDYQRKVNALQRTTQQNPISPTKPNRDPSVTRKYRKDPIARVQRRWGTSDPQKAANIVGKIKTMDADHIQELQLNGLDGSPNIKMTNSGLNRSIGAQIAPQIRNLPPGTQIEIVEGTQPK
jgi:hypothetical protein